MESASFVLLLSDSDSQTVTDAFVLVPAVVVGRGPDDRKPVSLGTQGNVEGTVGWFLLYIDVEGGLLDSTSCKWRRGDDLRLLVERGLLEVVVQVSMRKS